MNEPDMRTEMPPDGDRSVTRMLERLITAAEQKIETEEKTRMKPRPPSANARLSRIGLLRHASRPSIFIRFALLSGVIALAAWGCGFLSLIFNGEDPKAIQGAEACDQLSSGPVSELPMLVELRTDKNGVTSYRDMRLGGSDVDPQWIPTRGWVPAGNFMTMGFQPPLQSALAPGSVTFVAYAPSNPLDDAEQNQLHELDSVFGPELGTFRWNGRVFRYSVIHNLPCGPPPQ
ncbi:MAG TPA: hypothetical protein VGI29_06330 [Candidatus Binataceae bacterium]|jgi:hypothetical protein